MAKEKIDLPGIIILPYGDHLRPERMFSALVLHDANVVLEENENGDLVVIKNRYGPIGDIVTEKDLTLFLLKS